MRNILDFLIKYSHWALFILLQLIAAILLFRFNSFQGSVWFTSASEVTASVTKVAAEVTRYFGLKQMNRDLTERNIYLMQQLEYYKELVGENEHGNDSLIVIQGMQKIVRTDSSVVVMKKPPTLMDRSFVVCPARVVNISVRRFDNYLAIDKGESNGVRTGMGVISGMGVVGIVCRTSDNYSLVLPVINSGSSISCKIARTDYFGFLKWEGGDPLTAFMTDVPRHAEYEIGDTVVTSGHSTVFIEGIPVGKVISKDESDDEMSFTLEISLFTDFGRLNDVYVMALPPREELTELEKDIKY
ncbi:rod shape-determining protein MreC [Bacteroides caecigallinarum]|uniref:rod shape-determining protein MreC n=1 Tax=Bacteroides caecigallinarum TaxID=1411144 RepID=UPI001F485EE7|nr:rod shape-determining protein MreC [Bacteroides caecigallinarum]MCF2593024.1 rod shape-determining protein MreC [Bacteroides caecigallinarum]